MLGLNSRGFLALMTALIATPVLAQTPNFGSLTLAPNFSPEKATVNGTTAGSFSLTSLKNKDIHNRPCIGYGSSNPDHVIVLQKGFSHLRLQVNSRGKDTTLVVEGPDGNFRCGDDSSGSKDASIDDSNWKAGRYLVWVGSIESGPRYDYTLSVQK
jgi:hypothetical protein